MSTSPNSSNLSLCNGHCWLHIWIPFPSVFINSFFSPVIEINWPHPQLILLVSANQSMALPWQWLSAEGQTCDWSWSNQTKGRGWPKRGSSVLSLALVNEKTCYYCLLRCNHKGNQSYYEKPRKGPGPWWHCWPTGVHPSSRLCERILLTI